MIKELRILTVEEAKEILSTNNKSNRPIKPQLVEEIKNDILNGKFDTDNTFVVIKNGKLFYGQHTLSAIIASNSPLEVNVVNIDDKDLHFGGMLNVNSKYKY